MSWSRYKAIADQPNVFSRWMLEQSAELLPPGLAVLLLESLNQQPVDKPSDHKGGTLTDMFELRMTSEDAGQILEYVDKACTEGQTTSATVERGLGGFREAWQEMFLHTRRAGRKPVRTRTS